jgi:hypothetical protein
VVYKSRQCETVVLSSSAGDLCCKCEAFFSQLFGKTTADNTLISEEPFDAAAEAASTRNNLSSTGEDAEERKPWSEVEAMPAPLPAKERVDENKRAYDVTKTVIVLPSVGEMVSQEGGTHRKRAFRRTVPAVSCSDCGLDFRSVGAFKRHQRDWHAVDGDGGDMTAMVGTSKTASVGVVNKSCPYCTEQFPVSEIITDNLRYLKAMVPGTRILLVTWRDETSLLCRRVAVTSRHHCGPP